MPQAIPCDICGQTTADFVISYVADGQVVGVGVECVLDWAMPLAEAFQQIVEREQADAERPVEPSWVDAGHTPTDDEERPARSRKRSSTHQPEPEPEPEPQAPPADVDI